MIVVIEQHNAHEYTDLIDEMFRLRARVFGEKLNWDVDVKDGMERDKYDDQSPVYLIYTDNLRQRVIGSLRLLPMTGPTLLSDIFPDTLSDAAYLSSPTIWECTRFCLDEKLMGKGHREELLLASGVLIAGLGDVAIKAGIQSILGNFDSTMLRLYRRIGCEVEVLGRTERYGEPVYLGLFPISKTIHGKVEARLNGARALMAGSLVERELAA